MNIYLLYIIRNRFFYKSKNVSRPVTVKKRLAVVDDDTDVNSELKNTSSSELNVSKPIITSVLAAHSIDSIKDNEIKENDIKDNKDSTDFLYKKEDEKEKSEEEINTKKTSDDETNKEEPITEEKEVSENTDDVKEVEVKEETNLDIDKICGYIDFFDYISGSGKKSRQFNFWVKTKSNNNIKLSEHDEYKWLSAKECYSDKNITSKTMATICICAFNYLGEL